jgi:hypothetical protein
MILMDSSESFTVDLANPKTLLERLPEAEENLQRIEAELEEKEVAVTRWRQLVAVLQALSKGPEAEGPSPAGLAQALNLTKMQAQVVGVVNREMRKIRAPEVTAILNSEGVDITNDSVSNCLWYVAEKTDPSPIKRVGRGYYAPVSYEEGLSAADVAMAGLGVGALAALFGSAK